MHVDNWVREIATHGGPESAIQKLIVANKSDLEQFREVSADQGKNLAKQLNLHFFETSAKTGHNVEELFTHMAKTLVQSANASASPQAATSTSILHDNDNQTRNKKCC